MLVEMRPITSIRPYENNPRLNDPAVDAVAASIQEFGFRQPIVVDEHGVITGPVCDYPTIVCLDLPDGQPDMIALNGQWQSVPDGRALLRKLAGLPITVIGGIDPLVATGEKPGLRHQGSVCTEQQLANKEPR